MVEKVGVSLSRLLRTTDPFKNRTCSRDDCPVCTTGGKGKCNTMSVTYKTECNTCGDEYNGQTARTAYVRASEHLSGLENKNEKSELWQHCREKYEEIIQTFRTSVTASFKDDALLRQVTEAVKIRRVPEEKSMNSKEEYNVARLSQNVITRR